MFNSETKDLMVLVGYPRDSPIWPNLSTAVKLPPRPQNVAANKISISMLKSACKIV